MVMTDEEICRSYRQAANKKSQVQILADLNGTSKGLMQDKLTELGVIDKDERGETIKKLFAEGKTDKQIGKAVGYSAGSVYNYRKDYGLLRVTRKPKTEKPKEKVIKDSGDRTAFETGAVRDMHSGKGRMDLLPWYGIMEVSKLCEDGALKYGERNVDKGIPLHSLLDSGARHLAKVIAGMEDEDHLRAACWNLLWALNQRTTHPELDDMPKEAQRDE